MPAGGYFPSCISPLVKSFLMLLLHYFICSVSFKICDINILKKVRLLGLIRFRLFWRKSQHFLKDNIWVYLTLDPHNISDSELYERPLAGKIHIVLVVLNAFSLLMSILFVSSYCYANLVISFDSLLGTHQWFTLTPSLRVVLQTLLLNLRLWSHVAVLRTGERAFCLYCDTWISFNLEFLTEEFF